HPEWIDFPREGNGWSFKYARRQWSLADNPALRYHGLEVFDAAMIKYAKEEPILESIPEQLFISDESKVLIFKRGNSIFAFNFSPQSSYSDFRFGAPDGEYEMAFSSDDSEFGGFCRLQPGERHFTVGGALSLYLPCRTAVVLKKL
ncbi:MAG TPA: 1,4-alpha-glucan-branching enzyme, partial [Rikenellaceae bacterium]|nr:1,4-alpha-glucan-branching enzyme [Rikenellaceae bacterium]